MGKFYGRVTQESVSTNADGSKHEAVVLTQGDVNEVRTFERSADGLSVTRGETHPNLTASEARETFDRLK